MLLGKTTRDRYDELMVRATCAHRGSHERRDPDRKRKSPQASHTVPRVRCSLCGRAVHAIGEHRQYCRAARRRVEKHNRFLKQLRAARG